MYSKTDYLREIDILKNLRQFEFYICKTHYKTLNVSMTNKK